MPFLTNSICADSSGNLTVSNLILISNLKIPCFCITHFFPPSFDRISSTLNIPHGGQVSLAKGAGRAEITAVIQLGLSSVFVLVILKLRSKIIGSGIPFQGPIGCHVS